MMSSLTRFALTFVVVSFLTVGVAHAQDAAKSRKFCRYRVDGKVSFGLVEGDRVRQIDGNLFGEWKPTETTHALADVRLLVPTRPTQVLALAGNYKSHLNSEEIPEKLRIPQPFHKGPSSLLRHDGRIVIPKNSTGNVHYEAEMVIVIGKRTKDVSPEQALDYVLGVTCGNDVSERYWQNDPEHKDIQWWRAKGADTFGPCGPYIATGIDYNNLTIELRLNGEVKQKESTSLQIQNVADTVSFISRHVTLHPGDLIFTGTPGKTSAMKPGDVVEVELEGVGVLRNRVVAEK